MLKVIGVVKDFHFSSLHNAIEPILLFIQESPGDLLTIRMREENQEMTLRFIDEEWQAFGAAVPFRYEFMKERLRDTYYADEQTATVIRVGTIFTIILALLGLLGLSSFVAERKKREVGIRKVHGATVGNILFHLYMDFISLFSLAFLLAVPVAWWRLTLWLESEFVYHEDLTWDTFVYAGLFCMLIGTLTISYFIIRSARGNPVDAIKSE
jgi:putative ABC transport system permease protein